MQNLINEDLEGGGKIYQLSKSDLIGYSCSNLRKITHLAICCGLLRYCIVEYINALER